MMPDWPIGLKSREYPDGRYESGAEIADAMARVSL